MKRRAAALASVSTEPAADLAQAPSDPDRNGPVVGSAGGRASAGTILLIVLATFGAGMATIVPMAYSLSVRLNELAPGRADLLGVILGVGSAVTLVVAPLTGVISDRTRSRWGRRRPFTALGLLVGAASFPVMAFGGDLVVLGAGWVLCTIGWGTSLGSIGNFQADRLAPDQRGRVSGFTAIIMQVAPVVGILAVSLVQGDTVLVLAIPSAVGLVLIAAFILLAHDPDSRGMMLDGPLSLRGIVLSYGFRPRAVPAFAWNWLGRFIFFLGLTLTTSFTTFFFAQRLRIDVAEVAGVVALTSLLGVGAALVGALGSGWLSDRIGRRQPFVLIASVICAAGCAVSAFAFSLPTLIVGSLISSLGIAVFSSVGQALVLDVLPNRETEAGRYLAITAFSQKIPGVVAPLGAPVLLGIGGGQNFLLVYLVAAALTLVGGIVVAAKVRTPDVG